jgi:hypothetical protein
MRTTRQIGAAAILLALLGIAVRLWGIGQEPFWLDEAYSAYAADHGFYFLWHVVPRYETHPPFYYSLLHIWAALFGDGLISLRLPGVIAGLSTPPVIALAAREAGLWLGWAKDRRDRLCLVAFGLACLSIAVVEMSRQVRPYPLMILAYSTALVLMLRMARLHAAGRTLVGRAFVGYFLLLEAMLWLHNLGPLYALAMTMALAAILLRRGMRAADLGWLAAAHIVVASLYLPGLVILRDQAPAWVSHTWLRFRIDQGFFGHLSTLYTAPGWPGLSCFLLLALALGALVRSNAGTRLAGALLLLAFVPVVAAVAVSLTIAPVFITRTMTPVAVPAILLLALGATASDGHGRLLGPGGAIILGASLLAADVQARMAGPMQDWYRTIAWLAPRFRPGDQIFAYPNEGALPLHYALRDKGFDFPIRPIPTAVPTFDVKGGVYPTGSRGVASLPQGQLHAIAQAPETQAVPTIWLLRLGAQTYDPGDAFLHELHRGRYVVRSWLDGPIDIIGLRRLPAPVRNPR